MGRGRLSTVIVQAGWELVRWSGRPFGVLVSDTSDMSSPLGMLNSSPLEIRLSRVVAA